MIAATSVRELSDDAREVLVHRYIDGLYAIGAGKLLAAVTDLDEMCATMYGREQCAANGSADRDRRVFKYACAKFGLKTLLPAYTNGPTSWRTMFRAMFLDKTGANWFATIADAWVGNSEYERNRWLYSEVYHGRALGVAYLLSLGANPNYDDQGSDYSMLTEACIKGHVKIVRMLVANGADLEWLGVEQMTPLMWAAREGHAEVVRLLLAAGADKEARDIERWTPLVHACRYGKLEAARVLLEAGADVHVRVDEDWTPLRKAIEGNWEKVVALLLEHGADYDERYNNVYHDNTTVLMEAVLDRSYGSVQHLIAAGANVNAVDNTGSTALFYADAASGAMRRIIRRLFEAGIDGTIRDKEGKTALDRAEGQLLLSDILVKEMSRAREREQRAK